MEQNLLSLWFFPLNVCQILRLRALKAMQLGIDFVVAQGWNILDVCRPWLIRRLSCSRRPQAVVFVRVIRLMAALNKERLASRLFVIEARMCSGIAGQWIVEWLADWQPDWVGSMLGRWYLSLGKWSTETSESAAATQPNRHLGQVGSCVQLLLSRDAIDDYVFDSFSTLTPVHPFIELLFYIIF